MNPKIDLSSLSISKSRNELDSFVKYDIEVNLEEIASAENKAVIRYILTLLSNPKGIRINVEGEASIQGSESEIAHFLEQDENRVPRILHSIYQELFPLFYVNSKSIGIPCPAYKLSQISSSTAAASPRPAETAPIPFETIGTQQVDSELSLESLVEPDEIIHAPPSRQRT